MPFLLPCSPQRAPGSSGLGARSPGSSSRWSGLRQLIRGFEFYYMLKWKIWMTFLRFLSCLSPTQKKWYSSCFRSRKALCFADRLIICNSLNSYSDFVSLFQCPFLKGAYSDPQARSGLGICSLIVCSFLSPHLSKFVVIYFSLSFFQLIFSLIMSLRALWGKHPVCFGHHWFCILKPLTKHCCVADLGSMESARWLYHSLCPQGSSDLLSLFFFSTIPLHTQTMLQEIKTKPKTLGSGHWSDHSVGFHFPWLDRLASCVTIHEMEQGLGRRY